MYYVQQQPELRVTAIVLSAIVCLHQKTAEVIDQVSFKDISRSDPLVNHEDVTTTKKAIESWEDRLQAIEGRLDKMGVISEPSTSRSMFSELWLLK